MYSNFSTADLQSHLPGFYIGASNHFSLRQGFNGFFVNAIGRLINLSVYVFNVLQRFTYFYTVSKNS